MFTQNKCFLAFDTSNKHCSVAVAVNGAIYKQHIHCPSQHNIFLLPIIKQCLTSANLSLNQLDHLILINGPGSFTGLRIATAFAHGLQLGIDKKINIVPVSTLATLAQQTIMQHKFSKHDAGNMILVANDARMSQYYCGIYRVNKNGIAELCSAQEKLYDLNDFAKIQQYLSTYCSSQNKLYLSGNIWSMSASSMLYQQIKNHFMHVEIIMNTYLDAEYAIYMADSYLDNDKSFADKLILPNYIRNQVVQKANSR